MNTHRHIQAIRLHRTGGPEVLQPDDLVLGAPADHEIQIEHKAIGLNFIEIYHRTGLYPLALPSGLGTEAAGVVVAVGKAVKNFEIGQRVAYGTGPVGSYSTARNLAAQHVVELPDAIGFETAACLLLKGLTAHYLLRKVYRVQPGDTILFHAAAGGVGTLACQWAKALGARVIGTVSTPDKAELARANGCDEVVVTSRENLVDRVRSITQGKGVPVVYDSVGQASFVASLDCLQPRGMMVSFGNSSGPVDPVPLSMLSQRGSLVLTRPTLAAFSTDRAELEESAAELFEAVRTGLIAVKINRRFSLQDVAHAHTMLETRQTTGASVLLPQAAQKPQEPGFL